MSAQAQSSDKIKTIGQLRRKMAEVELTKFRVMVAIDFSLSNKWSGVHEQGSTNPIITTLRAIDQSMGRYICNGPIPAFRFGCKQSEDRECLPLNYPLKQDPLYSNVDALIEGYTTATQTVEMYGPSQLSPVFKKAISISADTHHSELLVCLVFTDGDVEDIQLDGETLQDASQFPICFVAIGLGNKSLAALEKFDDLRSRKFDNFQLVNYNLVNSMMNGKVERPDLVMALAAFNELPAAVGKLRKAKIFK